MSSPGTPFDWSQLLSQLGAGMIGQRNIGEGLGNGMLNYYQNQRYQNLLSKLFPQNQTPGGTAPQPSMTIPNAMPGMNPTPIMPPTALPGTQTSQQPQQNIMDNPIMKMLLLSQMYPGMK